jgi:phosphopantetheinyl transferase
VLYLRNLREPNNPFAMNLFHPLPTVFALSFERASTRFDGRLALWPVPIPEVSLATYYHYLSEAEQALMDSFGSYQRKVNYLAGRVCAKEALSSYTGYAYAYPQFVIDKGIFEYPVVRHPAFSSSLQVSISHCSDLSGAVAFSENHPVGIDIECLNPAISDFKEEIITDEERAHIARQPGDPTVLYTALWTAKEALSKILRTGLMTPFRLLSVDKIIAHPYGVELHYEHFHQYKCLCLLVGKRVVALAMPRKTTLVADFEAIIRSCTPPSPFEKSLPFLKSNQRHQTPVAAC